MTLALIFACWVSCAPDSWAVSPCSYPTQTEEQDTCCCRFVKHCTQLRLVSKCVTMDKASGKVSNPDSNSDSIAEGSESDWVDNTETLRAKWMLDGCRTLDEVCQRLQEQIWAFRRMQAAGWELTDEVLDDYGSMEKRPT